MSSSKRTLHFVLALMSALVLSPLSALAQSANNPRIALVIGNAAYADQALATTANDAGLIAQTLQAAGFDVVGARDLDGQSLRTAFRDFLDKAAAAGPDMQAFVYLSGGPCSTMATIISFRSSLHRARRGCAARVVRLSDFTHALAQTPARASIIVVDGARANPYAAEGPPLAPEFALVDPEPGELIAFNVLPRTLAGDEQGPYGVYGKTLAGAMRQGGVDVAEVFDQTWVLVNQETQGALIPWDASKLDGAYYIFERAADAPPPPIAAAAEAVNRPIAALLPTRPTPRRSPATGWATMRRFSPPIPMRIRRAAFARSWPLGARPLSGGVRSMRTRRAPTGLISETDPNGPHVADARRRLAILFPQDDSPSDFRPVVYEDLPPPPPDERFYEERPVYAFDDFGPPPPPPPVYYVYEDENDWRDLPPPPPPQEVAVLPALAIAIPLAIGAIAYHDQWHHNGVAPRGIARRLRLRPPRRHCPPTSSRSPRLPRGRPLRRNPAWPWSGPCPQSGPRPPAANRVRRSRRRLPARRLLTRRPRQSLPPRLLRGPSLALAPAPAAPTPPAASGKSPTTPGAPGAKPAKPPAALVPPAAPPSVVQPGAPTPPAGGGKPLPAPAPVPAAPAAPGAQSRRRRRSFPPPLLRAPSRARRRLRPEAASRCPRPPRLPPPPARRPQNQRRPRSCPPFLLRAP